MHREVKTVHRSISVHLHECATIKPVLKSFHHQILMKNV